MRKYILILILFILILSCDGLNLPSPDGCVIINFDFLSSENFDLDETVSSLISGTSILAEVPFDTDISRLIPDIQLPEGASSLPADGVINNFTHIAFYIVTSADGTQTSTYSVTLTIAEEE